jgi:oligopeptide transport system ATP-binding protein
VSLDVEAPIEEPIEDVSVPAPSEPGPGTTRPPVVDLRDLKVHFPIKQSTKLGTRNEVVHAVDGVSLTIDKGETLGLVGESGCGKSTLGRAVAGLYRPTSGHVLIDGVDISRMSSNELRPLRRRFQIVFQDPYMSLNPRMTVGGLIGEGLAIHKIGRPNERPKRVAELMDLVGLRREHVSRYPHEFSGGQRQRIAIARALAVDPELIVLDEPVSALDVSIQSQILRLLVDLQQRLGLTYLLIGHDLAVIGNTCQRVVVMYLGRVAETAERAPLYRQPLHPYTRALFSSAPIPDPTTERVRRRIPLEGEVPSPINPPTGCRFNTRCPIAIDRCRTEEPLLRTIPLTGRGPDDLVACHRAEEVAAGAFPVLAGSWSTAD